MSIDAKEYGWLDGTEVVFGLDSQGDLNVDVAYEHDLFFYARGYQRSAEMLFEKISEGTYADSQYIALAFLWRQAVELKLKALHADLDELDGIRRWPGPRHKYDAEKHAPLARPVHGHELLALWDELEPRFEAVFPGAPEHSAIRRVIEEFHSADPRAEDFRYPTRAKDGKRTLSGLPRLLSLRGLQAAMTSLVNVLDGAAAEIQVRLDYAGEARRIERSVLDRESER